MNPRYLLMACRILLGLVFLLACVHKILFPEPFALALFRYHVLPHGLINGMAITLPWIEAVVALSILFSRRFRAPAALLMLLMLVMFSVALGWNLARGVSVACGCFNSSATEVADWGNIMRNTGYALLAAAVLFEEQIVRRFSVR